jgi:hypothetical protein
MPTAFDPPANIPLYNYSDYLSPAYALTDFFNSWPLGISGSNPTPQTSSALYNESNFFSPGFFDSDYFNSIPYDNQPAGSGGGGPIVINMTALITPEFSVSGVPQYTQALIPITLTSSFNPTFSFTSDGAKNFVLSSIMIPTFSGNTQMVEGIIFGTVINPDFTMSSNTAVFYSMNTNITPTFTFSSPPVGKLKRKSFTLAIDKGYFAARQGPHVLNFYVMAR